MATPDALTPADIRLLAIALSPDYVYAAACAHGAGDPMLGAEAAYAEVRGMVRRLARGVLLRARYAPGDINLENTRSDIRRALEAMGMVGRRQPLRPLEATPWRSQAHALWPPGCPVLGWLEVRVPRGADRLRRAVVRALGRLLAVEPSLNRAALGGRIWQRETPEILFHVETGPDQLRPMILEASRLSDAETAKQMTSRLRGILRATKHPLAPVGDQLLEAWMRAGFLASPAGIMVSADAGYHAGFPALCTHANGIPLAVCIGRVRDGLVRIGTAFDHRVLDASHSGILHGYLEAEVPKLMED